MKTLFFIFASAVIFASLLNVSLAGHKTDTLKTETQVTGVQPGENAEPVKPVPSEPESFVIQTSVNRAEENSVKKPSTPSETGVTDNKQAVQFPAGNAEERYRLSGENQETGRKASEAGERK
jgi:hypothetical protein